MVRSSELPQVIEKLLKASHLAVDTETSGLRLWHEDRLFSIIIADEESEYYFNFQNYPDIDTDYVLSRSDISRLQAIFDNDKCTFIFANAKFDLAALFKEGIQVKGKIEDVLVLCRLLYNDHLQYSLAKCAERIGLKKSEAVEEYIKENGLFIYEEVLGERQKKKLFDRVPPNVIAPYGKIDARITFQLWQDCKSKLAETTKRVVENESLLIKTCFEMERVGIKIDRSYCERMLNEELKKAEGFAKKYEEICGRPYVESNKSHRSAFDSLGIECARTAKGNPSFDQKSLGKISHALVDQICGYREAYKKATTYYQSFLYYADKEDVIHANIKQAGTTTGRFSYSDPNLQNIPKEEKEIDLKVRRAFVPRENFCFVEFDYKTMEYRLMVEYAGEEELINKINAGLDVHEATAQMMGVDRKTAKTLNFMLLYGGGAQKLADALNINLEEAKLLKLKYFEALPNVKKFISKVSKTAGERGFIFNWLGRRSYFSDPTFIYKAPNALIQGGCAEIVKVAMNAIYRRLNEEPRLRSRMLLQVHDSLLFEMHKDELEAIWPIQMALENAYPSKHLKMEVSISHSWVSWADLIDGPPI